MALPRRRHGAWLGLLHAADNLRMAEIVLGEGPQDAERVTVRAEILALHQQVAALAERVKGDSDAA
jgi:cytochrome c556